MRGGGGESCAPLPKPVRPSPPRGEATGLSNNSPFFKMGKQERPFDKFGANRGGVRSMGEMIRMTMDDGAEIAVYHARAEGERRGGLVLVQEIFGVTDHIRELCDEYAGDGYEVLSPAMFDREPPGFGSDYSGPKFQPPVELARELPPLDQRQQN